MDYGKAFTYVFEDKEWFKKLGLGGLLFLGGIFIIPLFFPLGYMVETVQNVIEDKRPLLPEWDNWGEKFSKGAVLFAINLIYQLPAIVIGAMSSGLQFATKQSQSASTNAALMIPVLILSLVRLAYSLFVTFILPIIIIQYATTGKFEAAFRFKEMYEFIKNNLGDYFVVFLIGIVAGMIGGAGILLCCVGAAFTMFYSNLINANLYGQLYKQSTSTVPS